MKIERDIALTIASVALIALSVAPAMAHAQLSHAVPSPGSTVPSSPSEVTLNFSEQLEAAFSSVVVRDAGGNRVDKSDGHIDKADRTIMHASLQPLMPGTYSVKWRAVTVDTHSTEGTFTFRVGE
jgi:methionine-rich copper-binding protein CopC